MFSRSHCLGWLWHPRFGPRVTLKLTLMPSSSLSGSLWLTLWLSLAHSSSLWLTCSLSGSLWNSLWLTLAHSGSLWPTLAHSGSLWLTLAHSGSLWFALTRSLPPSLTPRSAAGQLERPRGTPGFKPHPSTPESQRIWTSDPSGRNGCDAKAHGRPTHCDRKVCAQLELSRSSCPGGRATGTPTGNAGL